MKKILICGATGFIGRNLAEFYSSQEGYKVIGVFNKRPPYDLDGLNWIKADLTNDLDVNRALENVDIIIQAAATTSGSKDIINRPYIHTTDNAVMNSLIFRAAYEKKIKHVIFFSCTVMLQSSDRPLSENDFDGNVAIHTRYFGVGWTKLYIEKMCEFYSGLGLTKFTAIRHSNIYGPHDKFDLEKSHVFGATITKVMSAKNGKVVVWGAGEESRDLLYVSDLINFVNKAITNQKDKFSLFNCGYGEAVAIKDLVQKIVELSGLELKIEYDLSQPSIKTSLFLDCTKAKDQLGWERSVSLNDGIAKTLQWWRDNVKA